MKTKNQKYFSKNENFKTLNKNVKNGKKPPQTLWGLKLIVFIFSIRTKNICQLLNGMTGQK